MDDAQCKTIAASIIFSVMKLGSIFVSEDKKKNCDYNTLFEFSKRTAREFLDYFNKYH